jgi:hypothetical protein
MPNPSMQRTGREPPPSAGSVRRRKRQIAPTLYDKPQDRT